MPSRFSTRPGRGLTRLVALAAALAVAPLAGSTGAATSSSQVPATPSGSVDAAGMRSVAAGADVPPVRGPRQTRTHLTQLDVPMVKPAATAPRTKRLTQNRTAQTEPSARGGDAASTSPAQGPVLVSALPRSETRRFGLVGVTWEPGFDASDLSIKVSAHVDGTWTAWENLDVHADNDPSSTSTQQRAGSIPTWTGEADGIGVRVFSADGDAPEDLQVHALKAARR